MRIFRTLTGKTILTGLLLTLPEFAAAACVTGVGATGAQQISYFIQCHVIDNALNAFGGIAAGAIFYYGIRMIIDAYKDQAFTDAINSFLYVLIGFIVIGLSSAFTNSFIPTGSITGTVYPEFAPLQTGLSSVIGFMRTAATGVFTLLVVLAGLRMVTTQGDEAEFDKWRKMLLGNCIGVMIMLAGGAVVTAVTNPRNPVAILIELQGISLFVLTIIGFAATISLIVAGVLLIISIDESMRDRAKRAIIGTLLALLVVLVAYTLIATFAL